MTATFYVGDAIETMGKLPEGSVDLVLTSPPFLALRSYLPADHPDKALEGGSQATPGAFIDWLIDVVEACDRVLAPHGSLCIELGDTYAGSGGAGGDYAENGLREGQPKFKQTSGWHRGTREGREEGAAYRKEGTVDTSLQNGGSGWPLAKSLSLIPELFRLTLVYGTNPLTGRQTERWRLRNVVRWVRPNPPVGALGDKFRPATSELMVFCKSAKRYFDLDSVREPARMVMGRNVPGNNTKGSDDKSFRFAERVDSNPAGAPPLDWWTIPTDEAAKLRGPCEHDRYEAHRLLATSFGEVPEYAICLGGEFLTNRSDLQAPLDWWNIPPGGYQGAHYAVFPPELCIKPIKAMCPEKVCKVCGEPSRRIVADRSGFDWQPGLAAHIKERREAAGFTSDDLNGWFGFKAIASHWEVPGMEQGRIPNPQVWPVLKERLGLSDDFDGMVLGERTWTESEIEYRDVSDAPSGWTQDGNGRVYQRLATRKDRIAPDRFSDCGHDDWRPGVVLDPFVGSGTTLMVATGHGRDAIGVDLDSRNFDLALERVGPFILERAS